MDRRNLPSNGASPRLYRARTELVKERDSPTLVF
jgi:hypothetical protein